ncbi:hypothetical protein HpCK14_04960 [Helicobacter pylori]
MLREQIYKISEAIMKFFDQMFKNAHAWHYNYKLILIKGFYLVFAWGIVALNEWALL